MVSVLGIGVSPPQNRRNDPSVEESSSIGTVEVSAVDDCSTGSTVESSLESGSVTGRRRGRCVAALDEVRLGKGRASGRSDSWA